MRVLPEGKVEKKEDDEVDVDKLGHRAAPAAHQRHETCSGEDPQYLERDC